MATETVRVAALGDIHVNKTTAGALQPLFAQVATSADLFLLAGDLTDYGLPEEAQALARELRTTVKIPIVAVLGNHDYESGKQDEITTILSEAGIRVLCGDACEVLGIGIAGVKGFVGGFGPRMLSPWGESVIKMLVHEAIEEALRLESALARLRTPQRIALLHYSPIQATVEGEPLEIYPFLGCSRLEEPLNRYSLTAVFHGHAHRGKHAAKTSGGVPVYNVALAIMRQVSADRPFHLQAIKVNA